jgi:hypothetical protein
MQAQNPFAALFGGTTHSINNCVNYSMYSFQFDREFSTSIIYIIHRDTIQPPTDTQHITNA